MKLTHTLTLVLALFLTACISGGGPAPESVSAMVGGEFYTQYSLRYEKDWKSTNYGRGTLLPINSKVTVVSVSSKGAVITLPDGQDLKLVNIAKYTGDVDVLVGKLLGSEPANFEGSEFKSDIENGTLRLGMTKEEVLMARGYPPTSLTASTDADRWVYQQNRFAKNTAAFRDGKLVEARGAY